MLKNRPKTRWNTRTMTLLGMMIAITIVLTRYLAVPIGGAIRFSMGSVCTIMTGIWFGPMAGALAGGLADVIGLMISPAGGQWIPLITVSAAVWGVIPAVLLGFVTGSRKRRIVSLCAIVTLTSVICQLGLTMAGLAMLYGWGIVPGRLVQFAGTTPLYCILVITLYFSPVTRYVLDLTPVENRNLKYS